MYLVKIDIIRSKPFQTILTLFYNAFLAGIFIDINFFSASFFTVESKITFFQVPAHTVFSQDLDLIPGDTLNCFSNNFFAGALSVNWGSVNRSHPKPNRIPYCVNG